MGRCPILTSVFFCLQLKQKDRILEGLRTELEELRGPLPSNYAAENNDDTMSLASEVSEFL